jgi:phosphatidylglycerophosphate synthase
MSGIFPILSDRGGDEMPDKGTRKKLTRVGGGVPSSAPAGIETKPFVASDESKAKAKTFRVFAVIAWLVAIGAEILAIVLLKKPPIEMVWLIVLIAADLIFAVAGSLMWKKANRLDPASNKDKVRFFIQNQLGAFISIIAFLPLVILVFTNKDMNGKQKGIVGSVAVLALLVAGFVGVDFNPPSQEQYAEQTAQVESLTGANSVFWTKSGTSYHLYSDCSYINTARTSEIFQGTVAQARELKNITDLCDRCAARAEKEKISNTGGT